MARTTEEALRESEQRYKRLLDSVTDYIYTVKVEKGKAVETFHGPACAKVTGYTSEEYVADDELWHEMVHEDDKDAVTELSQSALLGLLMPPLEHRIIHKNGSIRWVRNTIVFRKNERGEVVSYDGLISDITEQKHAQELKELHMQQIMQTDKMVTLGILVSGVAHEINNPNNFIMLNAKLFSKAWNDIVRVLEEYYQEHGDFAIAGMSYHEAVNDVTRLLSGLQEGAQRIQKIVNSLKDFSRKDRGDMNQLITINKVMETAVLITHNLIQKATSNFEVHYGTNLPKVRGNFQQLEQVIINLITNSVQALRSTQSRLRLHSFFDSEAQKVVIQVEDEGVGISQDELKHIFDPFFTTKRTTGGTGLGLSISYNIIKEHQGELVFSSEPARGTIASIVLPAAEHLPKPSHSDN